jgi:hypothetical protein
MILTWMKRFYSYQADDTVTRTRTKSPGWYISGSYRFTDWFETGMYYSEIYVDDDDKNGTKTPFSPVYKAYLKDTCLSMRFDYGDNWIFKIEEHMMEGAGMLNPLHNPDNGDNAGYDKYWWLFAAKITYIF